MIILILITLGIFNSIYFISMMIIYNVIDVKYQINIHQIAQHLVIYNNLTILLSQVNPLKYIIKIFNMYPQITINNHIIYKANQNIFINDTVIIKQIITEMLNKQELQLYVNDIFQFNFIRQLNSITFYQSLIFILIFYILTHIYRMLMYLFTMLKLILPLQLLNISLFIPNIIISKGYNIIVSIIHIMIILKGFIINNYKLKYYRQLNTKQIELYYKMHNSLKYIYTNKTDTTINQHMLNKLSKLLNISKE